MKTSQQTNQINTASFDKQHIKLTYITTCYFDKNSNDSIISLLKNYETYSPDLLDRIQFVIVDDGSPLQFEIPDFNLNIIWLRITENIPWNLGGARNLGAVYAKSDTILLTDLRCDFPEVTLTRVAKMQNLGRKLYRFYRYSEKAKRILPLTHANSFLMSRGHFFRFYGYDEEFCGNYGFFGGWLTRFHRYHGSWLFKMPRKYHYFRHDMDAPVRDHGLARDKSANQELYLRKRTEVLSGGAETGHSRLFLNFTWNVMKQSSRAKPLEKPHDPWWVRRHWLRTLFGSYR
jgi:hypothetical protein